VWRRIPPWHFPKKQGQTRPNSPAFDDDPDGPMSVSIAPPGRDPAELLVGHDGFALVELSIEDLQAAGQTLVPAPTAEDPHHAEVIGDKAKAKRTLAKAARWVVPPPG
jgi:hypothetical protein